MKMLHSIGSFVNRKVFLRSLFFLITIKVLIIVCFPLMVAFLFGELVATTFIDLLIAVLYSTISLVTLFSAMQQKKPQIFSS